MCFPAGLHYPLILPFGKVRIYGDISRIDQDILSRKSSHKDTPISVFLDILVGKVNK